MKKSLYRQSRYYIIFLLGMVLSNSAAPAIIAQDRPGHFFIGAFDPYETEDAIKYIKGLKNPTGKLSPEEKEDLRRNIKIELKEEYWEQAIFCLKSLVADDNADTSALLGLLRSFHGFYKENNNWDIKQCAIHVAIFICGTAKKKEEVAQAILYYCEFLSLPRGRSRSSSLLSTISKDVNYLSKIRNHEWR